MFTQLWFWLYVFNRVIGATCPYTSKVGSLLGWLSLIAEWVFIILTFFFAPYWWWGLILIGVKYLIIMLTPKVDPDGFSDKQRVWSGILSDTALLALIGVYILFFHQFG